MQWFIRVLDSETIMTINPPADFIGAQMSVTNSIQLLIGILGPYGID